MAAERETDTSNNRAPVGSLRDAVPAGISHKPEPVTTPSVAQINAWQRVQVARHPDRPHMLDYVQRMCPEFVELHGDRLFGEDAAIVGGLASFEGQTVMLLGQQKGRTTRENIARNFGLPQPEGYRKARRLMLHAARFGFPILTFLDTPGANPGVQSEERGVAQAIAENLVTMLDVPVPFIATVIGEGGSGGALAIGLGDRILMLENSIYSVASPEAAAAILWRDAGQAPAAAETMRITAPDLYGFGIADEVIPEPEGGAHNEPNEAIEGVRGAISRHLSDILSHYDLNTDEGKRQLLEDRRAKYRRMGRFIEG